MGKKLTNEAVSSMEHLADVISHDMKSKGALEHQYDVNKACEHKSAQNAMFETKANEVSHSTNTNAGAEWIPGTVLSTDFIDLVGKNRNSFISRLPGFHGRDMDKSAKVAVLGKPAKHDLNPEWTTGSPSSQIAQAGMTAKSDSVQIDQKQYVFNVDVSKFLSKFSTVVDVLQVSQRSIAYSADDTIEGLIINGDTETGATGNVNKDDGAPASISYYLGADGLIKTFLSDGTNLGTLAWDDFLTLFGAVHEDVNPENAIWATNRSVHAKAMGLAQFYDASIRGKDSVINTGAITQILGSDYYVTPNVGLAEADGKQSATGSNNTLGRLLYFDEIVPQYGFSGEYEIDVYSAGKSGYQLAGDYFMGLGMADKQAGEATSRGALGFNITV